MVWQRIEGNRLMSHGIFQRFLNRLAFFMPGGYSVRPLIHKLRGVHIGKDVWISQFVYIDEIHPDAVTIGDNASIGLRSSIFTHFYWGPKRAHQHVGPVHIGNDVFIGPHCVILPNVRIGSGAVVQAGSVISRNIPPNMFFGPPRPGPIAKITVPLTHDSSYLAFIRGLRPIKKGTGNQIE